MASLLISLFLFSIPFVSSVELLQQQQDQQQQQAILTLLERHEGQLNRLETLIQSLSKSVSALEAVLTPKSVVHHANPISASSSIALSKPRSLFSEKFLFSAVSVLESEPTCAAALRYTESDGAAKYFAVGDKTGKIHVISSSGDVIFEIPAISDSPVTSILSYPSPPRKNESQLFAGHGDGSIAAHRISESDGGGWLRLMLVGSRPFVRGSRDLDSPPVMILELHQIGRTRYIVAADGGGRIRVFTENAGTLYGTAISSSRPLAFMRQRLLFLTETGAGALDLRSMTVKESECEGLNGSLVKSYVFDGLEKSKAYGLTSEGDLIHIVLLGDAGNLKCRVRSIRKSEVDNGPVSIQMIRGYLLALTPDKFFVYNISSQYYGRVGTPRPLFFTLLHDINSILNPETVPTVLSLSNPLIATDCEKLVILGLGGGYIVVFRSNFPVFKSESNAVFWTVPVLLFLLFLIGIWQFYVKKRDSLGWTPEESFSAPSVNPAPTDRAFGDVSRELRGSLRGPPRRYVSPPSRYPGGTTMPFRPSTSEPGFRGTADLKYRGSNLETPPGFPSRRESLFPNAQPVEEHMD